MSGCSCLEEQAATAHAPLGRVLYARYARLAGVGGLFLASEQGILPVGGRARAGEFTASRRLECRAGFLQAGGTIFV
jgi:hypothetical protein